MKRILAVLFLLPLLVFANGDMPPAPKADETPEIPIRCNGIVCVISMDLAKALAEAHNAQVDEIASLKKQLDDLKVIKGCAKVEVPPKLKRERDS